MRLLREHCVVALIVRRIITKVLSQYYQQAFWFIAAALESSFAPRKQAAERIIRDTKVSQQQNGTGEQFDRFYDAASRLCKELLNLCNKSLDKQRAPNKLTMSKDFRELSLMVNLPVIIPTQAALTARLPPSGKVTTTHAPFPRERVTIASYDDAIHVMASLQLPRRISIRGSDGQMYSFLCKPKDDLRKDARMMEFNGMINKLLRKDPEGRRRNLYIRTYGVIPLNEDSGIIEWVPQTSGLRAIIQSLYSQVGNDINVRRRFRFRLLLLLRLASVPRSDSFVAVCCLALIAWSACRSRRSKRCCREARGPMHTAPSSKSIRPSFTGGSCSRSATRSSGCALGWRSRARPPSCRWWARFLGSCQALRSIGEWL